MGEQKKSSKRWIIYIGRRNFQIVETGKIRARQVAGLANLHLSLYIFIVNPSAKASPAKALRVMWFPAHPKEGSASMDRYWRELVAAQKQSSLPPDIQISSALGSPPAITSRAGTITRSLYKYFIYPLQTRLLSRRADVVHILDHSFAHLLKQVPAHVRKIVTVHDLAPLRDPGSLSDAQVRRFRKSVENLRRADLLLAVSEFTKRDIVALLGISEEKIQVVLEGVNADFFSRKRDRPTWWPAEDIPTFVSIGSTLPRKNLKLLPEIFTHLAKTSPGRHVLVRVGQKLPEELASQLRKILGEDGLIERGHASEDELAAVYQHADALIFPSLLEGFGLPLLEAMAAGCPVVASNASSLPEVGGEAALYFNPTDAEAASAHVLQVLSEPERAAAMRASGHSRATAFSWSTYLQSLYTSYREAGGSR